MAEEKPTEDVTPEDKVGVQQDSAAPDCKEPALDEAESDSDDLVADTPQTSEKSVEAEDREDAFETAAPNEPAPPSTTSPPTDHVTSSTIVISDLGLGVSVVEEDAARSQSHQPAAIGTAIGVRTTDTAESAEADTAVNTDESDGVESVDAAPPPETDASSPTAADLLTQPQEDESEPSAAAESAAEPVNRPRSDDTKHLAARRPGGGSPGIAKAVARSLWEEVVYPRARVKAALRRAEHHAKRFPAASAIALAFIVGLPFIMFMNAGFSAGMLGWAVFVAAALFFIVGCPLLLIYAWPLTVVAVAVGGVWVHLSMGEGALWLGVATISAMLILYFATTEVVPFLAAGLLTSFVRDSGTAVSVTVFCASSLCFMYYRYTMTGPLLYAGWVAISSALAAQIACWSMGDAMPLTWLRGSVVGPAGTTLWTITIATIAAFLVVPKKRRHRKVLRVKSLAEQLPPS